MKFLIYILVFLFATEGLFNHFSIGSISIVRLYEMGFFVLVFKRFMIDKHSWFINLLLSFVVVIGSLLVLKSLNITIFQNPTNTNLPFELLRLMIYVIHFYLLYYVSSKDLKYLQLILIINAPIMLIAFFQSVLTPLTEDAWMIKERYFPHLASLYTHDIYFMKRVTSLYSSSLPLSYVLISNIILTLYLRIKTNEKKFQYYFYFLGVISVFTLSRSLIIAYFVLLLYSISIKHYKRLTLVILSLATITFMLWSQGSYSKHSFDRLVSKDNVNRVDFAKTGLIAMIQYPLGLTEKNYTVIKKEYSKKLSNPYILKFGSHNGFVNFGLHYTVIGLFTLIVFLLIILRKVVKDKPLGYFFVFASAAYIIHIMAHNKFLFIDDFTICILLTLFALEFNQPKKTN